MIARTRVLPFIFLLGVVAEIASIIWVGQAVGVLATLLLMALGVAAGVVLLRSTGVGIATALRQPMAGPEMAGRLGIRVMLSAVAALLFILPGFFSDLVAVILLLPPLQDRIARSLRIEPRSQASGARYRSERYTVIDAEAIEVEQEDTQTPRRD